MTMGGPVSGLALIVGATPGRAILTDGAWYWRFPCPSDIEAVQFRPGEVLVEWCARLWPGGLAARDLQLLAEAVADGMFSAPPPTGIDRLQPAPLPLTPELRGSWWLWRAGSLAWLAAGTSEVQSLSQRLAQRLSIRGALSGPHHLHWLCAPPSLPEMPLGRDGVWTTAGNGWRHMTVDDLWTATGITDPAFGLLHRLREQKTARGWLAEAQIYPPTKSLRAGQWPSRSGCCGLATDLTTAWAKAAHEAAERSLLVAAPTTGCAAHPDGAEARRKAGWEAVERTALAAFWAAPGRPPWHPVAGSGGRLLWTQLPAASGTAVLVAQRDGTVIGTAAAPERRAALRAARDEISAMRQGGAHLCQRDACRLRGLILGGRVTSAPMPCARPAPLPAAMRARDVTPTGVSLHLATAGRRQPPALRGLPRWQV